ncbi:MAG: alpha/beta hydrolase [Ilumatobacteraceae bacterium]
MSRRLTIGFAWFVLLAGCGADSSIDLIDSSDTPASSSSTTSDNSDPTSIAWDDCLDGVECGYLDVPLDYDDPDGETISLYVARHLARDPERRIGSLLVNPGGPGFGGSILAFAATQIYSDAILDRFDVVGWDPRGTGESIPAIDCVDDYDLWFTEGDITPDTDAEKQAGIDLLRQYVDLCEKSNPGILDHAGTNNTARDMDSLRRALGEETISYFGFSYGSELGAVWVTLFPDTVRAAILDGAADPDADPIEASVQQLRGFEEAISRFLERCSRNRSCKIHNDGDAEGAFDDLMEFIDENPLPTRNGRPDLTRGMALTAVAQAMYDQKYWSTLESALAEAIDGDGSGLLQLWDAYYQRQPDGSYGNELEAFIAIGCADDDERFTIEEADSFVPRLQEAAPRFSPYTTGNYSCTFWPAAVDPRIDVTGIGAGPVIVIGTTGDASTPLESSRNMARALEDGRLLVVDAEQHTGYSASECAQDVVDRYLIDLVPPDDGTEC